MAFLRSCIMVDRPKSIRIIPVFYSPQYSVDYSPTFFMFFVRRVSRLFKKTSPKNAASLVDTRSRGCSVYYEAEHDGRLSMPLAMDISQCSKAQLNTASDLPHEQYVCPFKIETEFCCDNKIRREIARLNQRLDGLNDDDDQQRVILYNQLGSAYYALKAFGTSLMFFNKSFCIARSMKDSLAEAYACGRLADALRKQHFFREGIFHASRQVNLAEKIQNEECKSHGYFALASQYYFRAKYHLLESDSFEEEKDLDHRLGTLRMDLGLSTIIQDLKNAIKFYTMCSEGFNNFGYERKLATTCYYIGDAHFLLGDCKQALQHLLKAKEIGEQFDDNHLKQLIYSKLSSTYVLLSEGELANKFSREAVKTRIRIKEGKSCSCSKEVRVSSHEQLHELWTSARGSDFDSKYL